MSSAILPTRYFDDDSSRFPEIGWENGEERPHVTMPGCLEERRRSGRWPSLAVGTTGHPVANRNVSLDGRCVCRRMRIPRLCG